jgi:hypothetical protein
VSDIKEENVTTSPNKEGLVNLMGEAERVQTTSTDKLGLEEIVHLTNRVGLEFVKAKKQAEKLELLKPTIRAQIALKLDDGEVSEAKLRRLTESNEEYIKFIEDLSEARAQSEKLRIKYESFKNLFDARRSLLSYQKAEMKLL